MLVVAVVILLRALPTPPVVVPGVVRCYFVLLEGENVTIVDS